MADKKTATSAVDAGIKKYLSDPAAALTDSAAHMKEAVKGTPVEALAKQAAEATQQDEGTVMVGLVVLGLLVGLLFIGAVNIVTAVAFAVPAYSTLGMMQGPNAEKDMMTKLIPVYWIFFSGLLVCEQFGLLPIFIGNTLYAMVKGGLLFWMWEMGGSAAVFKMVKPLVDPKKA